MAGSTYKLVNKSDVVSRSTLLHEAIPITGSLVSGTYVSADADENIKNYSHGMYQSVYDYPYLSSSANHLFDVTCGYSNLSALSGHTNSQNAKKINIYNQMAQVLAGYDHTGSVLRFDQAGEVVDTGTKINEAYFINFSRLLIKDEIKKGTFELKLGVEPHFREKGTVANSTFNKIVIISDASGSDVYKVNSPAGEYGILYATGSITENSGSVMKSDALADYHPCGLIFYQAGVAVISGSLFSSQTKGAVDPGGGLLQGSGGTCELAADISGSGFMAITGSTIETMSDGLRNRIYNVQFNNTTELNSTIYFCRINHNEFNYSTNPTYTSGSQIVVKEDKNDTPVTYVTSVGLYNAQNELLAVAKTSEPLVKTPEDELTIRVRLDY